MAADHRPRPLVRARVAVRSCARRCSSRATCCCRGSAPTSPCGRPIRTAIRSGASCTRSRRSRSLPPSSLVLPSHGLPFRGIPMRVAQLRAHHDARLAELVRSDCRAASAPVSAARHGAGAVPARARPAAALLRDGRGHRASQLTSGGATASARLRAADGTLPLRSLNPKRESQGGPPCPHLPPKANSPRSIRSRSRSRSPSAAEKSAKVMGEFATRNAGSGRPGLRRARPRQGVHGARGADARQSRRGSPSRR